MSFVPIIGDILETPIDIVLIALCYMIFGPISLVLCVELIPFIDIIPVYLLFAIFVFLRDEKEEESIFEEPESETPKEVKPKKSKKPTCIICLEKVEKENLFFCVCGSTFHHNCFSDFAKGLGCPICKKPLKFVYRKKGLK